MAADDEKREKKGRGGIIEMSPCTGRDVVGGFVNCYNYRNKARILYNEE